MSYAIVNGSEARPLHSESERRPGKQQLSLLATPVLSHNILRLLLRVIDPRGANYPIFTFQDVQRSLAVAILLEASSPECTVIAKTDDDVIVSIVPNTSPSLYVSGSPERPRSK